MERNQAMRACLALCLLAACARASGEPRPASEGPLVVELFTSQGCSSCPPADQLLSRLATQGVLGDRTLAPLAFHVDYWNDLGWSDPYSSPAWTERQHQYSRAIGDARVYTPELVVGGATGVIGSNLAAITDAVERSARPALLAATAAWSADGVSITATAPADADVWVAVWEDGTRTSIPRGENAGETLTGDRVVRRLERIAAAGQKATAVIPFAAGWHAGGAVAFAQRSDRRIVASMLLPRRADPRQGPAAPAGPRAATPAR